MPAVDHHQIRLMSVSRRLKWLLRLALFLLAVSLVVNLVLAKALHDSFAKLHFARVFPLGYAPTNRPIIAGTAASNLTISFWGDSRAFFWDKLALGPDLTIHDFAHGGMTSSQLILQLQGQPLVPTDYAVVQIGINDLHPLGVLSGQKQLIMERLRQNVLLVRDALLIRSKVVVLTTLFPPGRVPLSRSFTWDPATLDYIREVNEIIRRATDGKRVLLLDAHVLLADSSAYLADGLVDSDFFLHVNRDAYARLNERLLHLVRQHQQQLRN